MCCHDHLRLRTSDWGQLAFGRVAGKARCTGEDSENVPDELEILGLRADEENQVIGVERSSEWDLPNS
jgi:hypothetical protein